MDKELKKMLTLDATWKNLTSRDGRGDATYDAGTPLKCFIEGSVRNIKGPGGKEYISKFTLWFEDVFTMTLDDRLILPSGELVEVLQISPVYDELGEVDHYEVMV